MRAHTNLQDIQASAVFMGIVYCADIPLLEVTHLSFLTYVV